jgi:hypothetical protein
MSLPHPNLQRSFFDTDVFFKRLFVQAPADRFGFFAEHVRPQLVRLRPQLAAMYCPDNGRPAEEPVRLLGVLILQYMERLPDRQAAESCTYDLRWKLALGMEADETAFHPTSLVYFRRRLLAHGLVAAAFDAVLEALRQAGYLKVRKAQRLDSTHVLGLVSEMSRLECVRESLRLTLERLEREPALTRPAAWPAWWERYVESRPDYQASRETLVGKMLQAGQDARDLLGWTEELPAALRGARAIEALRRVFAENFEMAPDLRQRPAQPPGAVHNPHDPEAQWATKSTIAAKDKAWVGYKAQVAETVPAADDPPEAPTDAVITAVVTQPAISSDKAALPQVEQEWERTGQSTPEALYVDAGYTSGREIARAASGGRALIGPVQPAPKRGQQYAADAFDVSIRERRAICPAGQASTQCSRLEENTGKVNYRFEWNNDLCGACPLRKRCVGRNQAHRTLLLGEYHERIQERRRAMTAPEFKVQMHPRNGIEGTISELKRGYGLGRSRYRGLAKTTLQHYLVAAACNLKRWARRIAWEIEQDGPADRGAASAWAT